jgi:hypothetical protein
VWATLRTSSRSAAATVSTRSSADVGSSFRSEVSARTARPGCRLDLRRVRPRAACRAEHRSQPADAARGPTVARDRCPLLAPDLFRNPEAPFFQAFSESGRRVSNPRPSAWEADALPTELRPRRGDQGSRSAAASVGVDRHCFRKGGAAGGETEGERATGRRGSAVRGRARGRVGARAGAGRRGARRPAVGAQVALLRRAGGRRSAARAEARSAAFGRRRRRIPARHRR